MEFAGGSGNLGLERYAEAFRANDVDARCCRRSGADDLKELGVASLGHRKKLLEAIAAAAGAGRRNGGASRAGPGSDAARRPSGGS